MAARVIATNPAGHKLCLIGGFRYRFLNHSCRTSLDIDYHWGGDIESKQTEIIRLLREKLLPEVKRRLEYDGTVRAASGPDADSPLVKTAEMIFYRAGENVERIVVPVEITTIVCLDQPVVRTAAGTVYLTASDADLIESKVLAVLNRAFLEARDIVDLFLFQDSFVGNSPQRIKEKLGVLHISSESTARQYRELLANRLIHARRIDEIIEDQIDSAVAANLKASGGGTMVFDTVVAILNDKLKIANESKS